MRITFTIFPLQLFNISNYYNNTTLFDIFKVEIDY